MRKNAQINIRFEENVDSHLTSVALALGVSKSALVRRLTEAFLAEVAKTGSVQLEPTWIQAIKPADGRSAPDRLNPEPGTRNPEPGTSA